MEVCQEKVKEFFDRLAPTWDAGRETHPERIEELLNNEEAREIYFGRDFDKEST